MRPVVSRHTASSQKTVSLSTCSVVKSALMSSPRPRALIPPSWIQSEHASCVAVRVNETDTFADEDGHGDEYFDFEDISGTVYTRMRCNDLKASCWANLEALLVYRDLSSIPPNIVHRGAALLGIPPSLCLVS